MKREEQKNTVMYTISELADELDISTRAIRFYEEKGLILPKRTKGNHRVYNKRDRARLKLILRGKRLGYSLEEISEMIGLANFNMEEEQQLKKTFTYGKKKLIEINERMQELQILKEDLLAIQQKISNRMEELKIKNSCLT
ncbi:MAG: MerR family DNA-binding transcriptional regulator [Desulfobacteraceae bacterium]|nr:MerR family DNA-binding transcriptional regulator [Desulfobacteraceae bacterium]MBC2757098.1 MerR family DNA-binding transcriptional regulator [Desulfobacteraceae bacterium]MBC2763686.1 MerR family DNA-binding transcriptional regulator [ANME-2 cluster archaeon]